MDKKDQLEQPKKEAKEEIPLAVILGLDPALLAVIEKSGLSFEKLKTMSDAELLKIDGIQASRLARLREVLKNV